MAHEERQLFKRNRNSATSSSTVYQLASWTGSLGLAMLVVVLAFNNKARQQRREPAPAGPQHVANSAELELRLAELAITSAKLHLEDVSSKLMALNPKFDGVLSSLDGTGTPKIEGGLVTELKLNTDNVNDLSPLHLFTELKMLACSGSKVRSGKIQDLSPLSKLKLESIDCGMSHVCDLSPLALMPLITLNCAGSNVTDLSPLRAVPLIELSCDQTDISDLSPLATMKLTTLIFDPGKIKAGLEAIRQMESLTTIATGSTESERYSAEEFWKKYDAGDFSNP